jgi:proline iminopeptidase
MPAFTSPDGTNLVFHVSGDGSPLICLPGGPMRASVYLGDLGGLSDHRQLVLFDLRGTGDTSVPADVRSYGCDRLVADVEALRIHLGLDRIDLLGHSAGANLAVMYAAAFPERVRSLLLITPSTRAVDIAISAEMRLDAARLREGETWFDEAFAALERTTSGNGVDTDWVAINPFMYGRWDAVAQAHHAAEALQQNTEAAGVFGGPDVFTPEATRAAIAALAAPVLLVAGQVDVAAPPFAVAAYANMFRNATSVIQPEAGHYPWLDNPERFVAIVASSFAWNHSR